MLDTTKTLLQEIKKYFNEKGSSIMSLNYSDDNLEKKKEIEALDYLEEKGYIVQTANAAGFVKWCLVINVLTYE